MLQRLVDKVALPPARRSRLGDTAEKTGNEITKQLTMLADTYQSLNQGLSGMKTFVQSIEPLTPETP